MSVLFAIASIPYALKMLWNFALPYAVVLEHFRAAEKPQAGGGISLMPAVEGIGLVLATAGALANAETSLLQPLWVFLVGLLAIFASYVHLVVVVWIAGRVIGKRLGR